MRNRTCVIFASVFFLFFIKTSISSTTLCLLVWSEAWSILGWKLVWDVETEQDVLFISTADSLRQHVCLCYSHEHTITPPFNSFPLYISVSQPLILSVIFFSIHSLSYRTLWIDWYRFHGTGRPTSVRIDPQDVDGSLETTALTNAFILLNNSFSDLPAT